MLGSKFFKFLVSILKRKVNSFSNFASFFIVMTQNCSVSFKLIHFLLYKNGSHQSPNFGPFKFSGENLLCSSSDFPNHKSVFLQTLHYSFVSWKITPLYFFRSDVIYFAPKEAIKVKLWELWVLRSKFTKFLSSLKQRISFSWNFAFLFSVMRHNSSISF